MLVAVGSICTRSGVSVAKAPPLRPVLICVHVLPASVDFHTPVSAPLAYTTSAFVGSIATELMTVPTGIWPAPPPVSAADHVAPPSLLRKTPVGLLHPDTAYSRFTSLWLTWMSSTNQQASIVPPDPLESVQFAPRSVDLNTPEPSVATHIVGLAARLRAMLLIPCAGRPFDERKKRAPPSIDL